MKSILAIFALLVLNFFAHAEGIPASEAECKPKAAPHKHRGVDIMIGAENLSKERARACRLLVEDPVYSSIKIFFICNEVAELAKNKMIPASQAAEATRACESYFGTKSLSLFQHKGKNCIMSTGYVWIMDGEHKGKQAISYTLNSHRIGIVYKPSDSNNIEEITDSIKDECIK